jgi:hypothetical protein
VDPTLPPTFFFAPLSASGLLLRPGKETHSNALYAILCYDGEDVVEAWTPEQDAVVIAKLDVVTDKLAREDFLFAALTRQRHA